MNSLTYPISVLIDDLQVRVHLKFKFENNIELVAVVC